MGVVRLDAGSRLMRAWVEIDLDALWRNATRVKSEVGRDVDIIAVVKADAYGHGLKEVTETLDPGPIDQFAVVSLEEARNVRRVSNKPVLIMGYLDTKEIVDAIEEGFVLSMFDKELIALYERFAARLNCQAKVQLKVETGLNRLGMSPEDAVNFITNQHLFPHIKMEAAFSHLYKATSTDDCQKQLRILQELIMDVGDKAPVFPMHLVSSYGLGHFKAGYLDAVRVGLALYGVDQVLPDLEPIFQCKSVVMEVHPVAKGEGVSYNHLFTASQDLMVAIAPIGYAEGLSVAYAGNMTVLIQGIERPVIGQICMNHVIIDVTGLDVHRGEEVVIIGTQKDKTGETNQIRVADLAKRCSLRHHEIVTRLGSNLPRLYSSGNKPLAR